MGNVAGDTVIGGLTVIDNPDEAELTFPAASVALAVIVCAVLLNAELVIDQVPSVATTVPKTVVPLVSYKVTVAPNSAVPVKTGVVIVVMLSVFDVPSSLALARSGVEGGFGSPVSKDNAGEAPALPGFPAASV